MRIGVIFPTTEAGTDPHAIADYARGVEAAGYHHILTFDHVLLTDPAHLAHIPNIPYTHENQFHEVFTLLAFIAAVTQRVELVPGVLVVAQRETALVAKQAAQLDILSGGRLRLGVGTGWNPTEYEAMGQQFRHRGRRQEEQIQLMRELWTQPLVDFAGAYHTVQRSGINPLPVQQPIPIWFGGKSERTMARMARLGDGWIIPGRSAVRRVPALRQAVAELHDMIRQAGRSPAAFGLEGWIPLPKNMDPGQLAHELAAWRELGATHISVHTMKEGFDGLYDHLHALEAASRVLLTA